MKNSNKEPMKLKKSGIQELEAGAVARQVGGQAELGTNMGNHLKRYRGGKRRFGNRVFTGLGGWEVGNEWNFFHLATGFAHLRAGLTRLCPDKSTQVVDFQHIENVRLFWEGHEFGFSHGQAELGTKIGKLN